MGLLIVLGFIAALAILVWSAIVVAIKGKAGTTARYLYVGLGAMLAVVAFLTTYRVDYFSNENTHIHGWPVPVVIFQRDDVDAPWLDFVGPTILLALPMNFIIFMLVPSVLSLCLAYLRTRWNKRSAVGWTHGNDADK